MAGDNPIEEFKKSLVGTSANQVDLGDRVVEGDYLELVQTSLLLAKEFGLGGCKSFTEFVRMVDDEDPLLIEALCVCIVDMYQKMNGEESKNGLGDDHLPPEAMEQTPPNQSGVTGTRRVYVENAPDSDIVELAVMHGYSPSELREKRQRVDAGKINKEEYNFDYLTKEWITSASPEEISKVLKDMDEYRAQTENVNLSLSDFNPFDIKA